MSNIQLQNHLADETSPYLLQHKDNPVHWFSWGPEAFAAAQELQRPIFLSIGYSTCYWCHVMEGDSFEQDDVAAVLNKHFVCIKVDREERPDVDKLYMDAVMAISGHGGWPLSAFLTPSGEPFFAATFFWRTQFIDLLQRVAELWSDEREKFLLSASEITSFLNNANRKKAQSSALPDSALFEQFINQTKQYYDKDYGGFGQAPKFPQAERLSLLLRLAVKQDDSVALGLVTSSLDAMVRGGLYDHIGGGFHRYSVDAQWLVPHFEKMLYDNALLARLYIDAHRVTKNNSYKQIAAETLDYLLAEMQDEKGAFYAAQDAGEVGEEGEYYTWTLEELRSLLSDQEIATFVKLYELPEQGNFEGRIIPRFQEGHHASEKDGSEQLHLCHKLYTKRLERKRPHRDEKVVVDWNGLAISAFAEGYRLFGSNKYKQAAESAAQFILAKLYDGDVLLRSYCAQTVKHRAVLSDYSYLIEGLLSLYRATWEVKWFASAQMLQKSQDAYLWDEVAGGYFFAEAAVEIKSFAQSKEFSDGATPAGNAIAVSNLLTFYYLDPHLEYLQKAERLLGLASEEIAKHPFSHAGLLNGFCLLYDDIQQVVVVGAKDLQVVRAAKKFLDLQYLPHVLVAWSDGQETMPAIVKGKDLVESNPAFYLCKENSCQPPVTNFDALQLV